MIDALKRLFGIRTHDLKIRVIRDAKGYWRLQALLKSNGAKDESFRNFWNNAGSGTKSERQARDLARDLARSYGIEIEA